MTVQHPQSLQKYSRLEEFLGGHSKPRPAPAPRRIRRRGVLGGGHDRGALYGNGPIAERASPTTSHSGWMMRG
jgi:hypothetical protein